MARRTSRLGRVQSKPKVVVEVSRPSLDYHEGLSANQAAIICSELRLDYTKFCGWMYGQTCPLLERQDRNGARVVIVGVYEYDLFRWIASQKTGVAPSWD